MTSVTCENGKFRAKAPFLFEVMMIFFIFIKSWQCPQLCVTDQAQQLWGHVWGACFCSWTQDIGVTESCCSNVTLSSFPHSLYLSIREVNAKDFIRYLIMHATGSFLPPTCNACVWPEKQRIRVFRFNGKKSITKQP